MKYTIRIAVCFVCLLSMICNSSLVALACGPFTTEVLFSFNRHPDYPLADFARGKVGIVPGTFGRASLFLFYRQLNNANFTAREQKELIELLEERIGIDNLRDNETAGTAEVSSADKWLAARKKVLGADAKIDVQTERRVKEEQGNFYNFYDNCYADAFTSAAKTLDNRAAQFGATSENVKDWLRGQDAVFSNCYEGEAIPAATGANAPAWLQKDRDYQQAAALFYAAKLPEARAKFEQIASDKTSDWNKTANYLIARTFIRQSSFTENAAEKSAFLEKAQTHLQNILATAEMFALHRSARGLLNLVKYRLQPDERRRELASVLVQSTENDALTDNLIDYLWLIDRVESVAKENGETAEREAVEKAGKQYDYNYDLKLADVPQKERTDDLTDWIFAYQSAEAFAHSYAKWQETKSTHWFVAAIVKAQKDSSELPQLIAEADKIREDSPAFATARFHQIRLLLETGRRAEARQKLDAVFAAPITRFPVSTANKFLSERMFLAENLNDFLRDAQRRSVVFISSDDGNEEGFSVKDDENLKFYESRTMFDGDAVKIFNEKMSLKDLREAALNPTLPEHLKKSLVVSVWMKSFISKNATIEREFAPLVSRYDKDFQSAFAKYLAATNPAEREAAGLLFILRNPAIQPYVLADFGRDDGSSITAIDSIRGNWWCAKREKEERYESDYGDYFSRKSFQFEEMSPAFLSPASIAQAKTEREQLAASGNSATFLSRRALEFANANPTNPNTPEILHLAVRATRYGCRDCETGKYSKAAHDLLKQRFPRSEWTKKTQYWFKDESCETAQ